MTIEEAYRNYWNYGWITIHKNGVLYLEREENENKQRRNKTT